MSKEIVFVQTIIQVTIGIKEGRQVTNKTTMEIRPEKVDAREFAEAARTFLVKADELQGELDEAARNAKLSLAIKDYPEPGPEPGSPDIEAGEPLPSFAPQNHRKARR